VKVKQVMSVCRRLGDRTFGQKTFGRQVVWENGVWATGEGGRLGGTASTVGRQLLTDSKAC